jgi:DNA invertase Pin-like site-specific DNA recombinase
MTDATESRFGHVNSHDHSLCVMVFTVLGAVAELERNLIVERVPAGLRHARSKGKTLGRPKKSIDAAQVLSMRDSGDSWRVIARRLGVSVGKVFGVAREEQAQKQP